MGLKESDMTKHMVFPFRFLSERRFLPEPPTSGGLHCLPPLPLSLVRSGSHLALQVCSGPAQPLHALQPSRCLVLWSIGWLLPGPLLPSTRPPWAGETVLSPEVSSLEARLTLGSLFPLAPHVHHAPPARPSAVRPSHLCSTTTPPQPCFPSLALHHKEHQGPFKIH